MNRASMRAEIDRLRVALATVACRLGSNVALTEPSDVLAAQALAAVDDSLRVFAEVASERDRLRELKK